MIFPNWKKCPICGHFRKEAEGRILEGSFYTPDLWVCNQCLQDPKFLEQGLCQLGWPIPERVKLINTLKRT